MGGTQTQITPDPTALQTALGWTSVLGGIMNPNIGTQNVYPGQTTSNQGGGATTIGIPDTMSDIYKQIGGVLGR
jgi:hypothetical protein